MLDKQSPKSLDGLIKEIVVGSKEIVTEFKGIITNDSFKSLRKFCAISLIVLNLAAGGSTFLYKATNFDTNFRQIERIFFKEKHWYPKFNPLTPVSYVTTFPGRAVGYISVGQFFKKIYKH